MICLIIGLLLVTSVFSNPTPLEYDITITPDIDSLTFISETKITFEVLEAVNTITLNSRYLEITGFSVLDSTGTEIEEVTLDVQPESEIINLHFENELSEDLIEVTLEASGNINEGYEGLYISKYWTTIAGGLLTERSILLTDFRYNKARQVFPSIDDPAYPSTFTLKIVRPNEYTSVSNMVKTLSVEIEANYTVDTFARTDPIPTYLLGFALAYFIEDTNPNTDSSISVYRLTRGDTTYLRDFSATVIQEFQELYPYRLNKIHQIVVPDNCLSSDVVEQIGLIFYKESAVLYDEARESSEDKQEIGKIVAHAIVRQWYKDLSSFEWRPTSWVSEGITTAYEFDVLQKLEPSWRLQEQFLTEDLLEAFKSDVGSEAISLELAPGQTPEVFTKLQATKSYSLVRMFSHLPTPGSILEDENNPVLVSWSQNVGYPTVKVTKNGADFTFVQDQIVPIPINVAFDNQLPLDLVLETKDLRLQYNESEDASWYLANADRYGYYRINYGDRNWRALSLFLRNPSSDINDISPLNRAILIEETFHFAQQNRLNITVFLELIQYLQKERDFIPLNAFIKTANELRSLLSTAPVQRKFESFAVNLIQHLYEEIGTTLAPSDDHSRVLTRSKILTWLCNLGHSRCRQETNALLSRFEGVHPDLQDLVYCGGMHLGGGDELTFLLIQHNIYGKKRIINSIPCNSDEGVLWYYISAVVDNSTLVSLREEDKVDAFLAVVEGNNDVAIKIVIAFVRAFSEQLLQRFTVDEVSKMFTALSKKVIRNDHQQLFEEIFASLTDEQKVQYEELFTTVNNTIVANRNWQDSNAQTIERWLDANYIEPTTTTTTTTTNITTTTTTTTTITTTTTTTPSPSGGRTKCPEIFALIVILVMQTVLLYN